MEELDLKEIFNMFWTRIGYIILIVIVFAGIGAAYSYMYVTPNYKATTKLVLSTSNENGADKVQTITTADITLNNNLVTTYSELIRSKSVLSNVIKNLNLSNFDEESLKSNITVNKSTQSIDIFVVNENPYNAKVIADEVAEVFINKVEEVYGIKNVYVWDKADIPENPYNINHVKDIVIFAGIGFVISCVYVIIANMFDTTVKNKEDVEKRLGLTVLVSIPVCDFEELIKPSKKGGKR